MKQSASDTTKQSASRELNQFASDSGSKTKPGAQPDPDPDPDRTYKESAGAAPLRSFQQPVENSRPLPTAAQLAKMAHAAMDADPTADYASWKEDVKCTLARTGFAYDAEAAGKALDSALRQRELAKIRKVVER